MRRLVARSVVAFLALASTALAQITEEGVRPDNIDTLEAGRPILEYVLAGAFLVGVLAIGFKNSKRTHLD